MASNKRGNERYNLMIDALEHKATLFGKMGARWRKGEMQKAVSAYFQRGYRAE
ncbi:MAG: hypothetical protein RSC90_02550 [Clostridia bacterium]